MMNKHQDPLHLGVNVSMCYLLYYSRSPLDRSESQKTHYALSLSVYLDAK